ncbi:motility associated factor glycosyltransferase family protein [Clostridium sp. CAG:265]|uniref:motility associated factor glycosyltransferase family protein n=1 Tax=Clostridium sp. CAG:265 TaxID=1262787 RepID=UPI0026724F3A|nr:6-hydroxymethylpterin diphosphokinase MptE-like protein [Clostridium sp. CAG:265]
MEKSKDNLRILKVKINNKERYLGSYYNHKKDIDNFINAIGKINDKTVVVTYGVLDGEYLLELSRIKSKSFKIIVFEKSDELIKKMKNDKYYNDFIEDERIKIFKYDESKIDLILKNELELANIYNVKTVDNEILYYYNSEEILKITKELKKIITHNIINDNTIKHFSERWFESFVKNFKYTLNSIFFEEIKNKFKNKSAIVISAGPSLEKNIELLKECHEKFVIISGGRTLEKLKEIGVKPDFFIMIDGDEIAYDLVKENLKFNIPLIFCNATNEKILQNHDGIKIYEPTSVDFIMNILNRNAEGRFGGGSVAHACISTAIYLGCNNIIFIGQDLAYTNDKVHAEFCEAKDDKYKEEEVFDNIINKNDLFVDDIYGKKVRTSNPLNMFRENIEVIIKQHKDIKFINATEGGAHINGSEVKFLNEVIDLYGNSESINKNLELKPTLTEEEKDLIINEFKKTIQYLRYIKIKCSKLIEFNEKLKNLYNKDKLFAYDKLAKIMDILEKELKELYLKVPYIKSLIYPIVVDVEINPIWNEDDTELESEKFEKLYDKTKFLYSTMKRKTEYALNFIEKEWDVNE